MTDQAQLRVPAADPLALEARIRAYAAFGPHRTGWPADDRTTNWLVDELRAAGIDATAERFRFPRVEVRAAHLTWDGERVEGEPMYDGGFTLPGGVAAEIAGEDDPDPFGKIVLASDPVDRRWTGIDVRDHYEQLADAGAVGAVVPTGDRLGEVMLRNASNIARPFDLPVLQIARRDLRRLGPVLLTRHDVTLEIDADRLRSTATNVVATIPGDDPDAAPLVVITPKSGWFACAAERGSGIAAWLAIAEGVASLPSRPRTVHLVATSGHELGRHGLAAYCDEHADLLRDAACWVHLGSSLGIEDPAPRVGASDAGLLAVARRALEAAGARSWDPLAPGDPGVGEAREIHEAGGRFITMHGLHPYFHSPNDTVEVAVDLDGVARWTRAVCAIVSTLLEHGSPRRGEGPS